MTPSSPIQVSTCVLFLQERVCALGCRMAAPIKRNKGRFFRGKKRGRGRLGASRTSLFRLLTLSLSAGTCSPARPALNYLFSGKPPPPLAQLQRRPWAISLALCLSSFFPQFLPAIFINLPRRRSVRAGGSLKTMRPENFCQSLHMLLSALIPIRGGWHTVLFIPISSWIHLPRNELHK